MITRYSVACALRLGWAASGCAAETFVEGQTVGLEDDELPLREAIPVERTASQARAQNDLSALLDRIEGRAERSFPDAWEAAATAEIERAFVLARAAAADGAPDRWRRDLDDARARGATPSPSQV